MSDQDERGRRFSEREVGLIIKRASEMQQSDPAERGGSGMSLAELEQIASEAGIDPQFVRRAASDIDVAPLSTTSPLLGGPTTVRLERTINGEVPDTEFEALVLEIHNVLGEHGHASELGRSLTWTSAPVAMRRVSSRRLSITVSPRAGVTTIRIEEHLGHVAGGLFAGLMGGLGGGSMGPAVGIGIGALHSGLAAAGIAGAVIVGSYALARGIFGHIGRRRSAQLQTLMERLARHVSETAVVPPASLASATSGGRRLAPRE